MMIAKSGFVKPKTRTCRSWFFEAQEQFRSELKEHERNRIGSAEKCNQMGK